MNVLEEAMLTALKGNSSLTALLATSTSVFNGFIPHGEALPAVVFRQRSGVPEPLTPREYGNFLYAVEGVTDEETGGRTKSGQIQDQIHATLQDATLSVTGWGMFACYRAGHIRFTEVDDDGQATYRSGGVYRIRLSKD